MTGLDIALIIIGCVLVIVSFFITEKISSQAVDGKGPVIKEVWSDKEETTIKERVRNIVSDKSEELIDTVEDKLCHLSNEKIMEFKEYSDQVLESIREEHKQAVFLYNMLNEKQDEMKKLFNDIDVKYAELSDKVNRIENAVNSADNTADNASDRTAAAKTGSPVKAEPSDSIDTNNAYARDAWAAASKAGAAGAVRSDSLGTNSKNADAVSKKSSAASDTAAPKTRAGASSGRTGKRASGASKRSNAAASGRTTAGKGSGSKAGPDRNDKILDMWKQGRSVIDISKQLGIGQGEVKLVIDLFKGV